MIPDNVMKEIYLSKEFGAMPCIFQSMALDAFERALDITHTTVVEDKKNATIHES